MKSSLLLPLKYILTVIILLVLFTLFKLFPLWGASFIPETGMTYTNTREMLPYLIAEVFLLAATLAVFLSHMASPINRRGRFLRFIFMLCASFFVLSVGFSLTTRYLPDGEPVSGKKAVLLEGNLNPLAESYLYPQKVAGNSLSGIVVFDRTASKFSYYRSGKIDSDNGHVIFPGEKEKISIDPPNPFFSAVFSTPKFLTSLGEDLDFFTLRLRALKGESQRSFLFYCFVISLFLSSCGTVARITRWPVFNILGLLLMFRALFYLYRIFSDDSGSELAGLISQRFESAQLPVIILILTAGILIIWDILFVPGPRKRGSRRYG